MTPPFVIAGRWEDPEGRGRPHPFDPQRYRARMVEGHAVYFPDAEACFSPAVEAEIGFALSLEAFFAPILPSRAAAFAGRPPPAGWHALENVR